MASRRVDCTCKDDDGNIVCLGGPDYGQVDKDTAIADIESDTHHYWVAGVNNAPVAVHVVPGHQPPYLRTDPDGIASNNLDDLPDC